MKAKHEKEDGKKKTAPAKVTAPKRKNPKLEANESGQFALRCASSSSEFGTNDEDLILTTANQLALIAGRGQPLGDREHALMNLNAAIASVVEIEPRDSTELMLATQMAAIHNASMDMLRRAMLSDQTFEGIEGFANLANKLMRTYTAQVEALNKYRTRGQQKITVQHVNVNEGGQAIVGDVQGVGND